MGVGGGLEDVIVAIPCKSTLQLFDIRRGKGGGRKLGGQGRRVFGF